MKSFIAGLFVALASAHSILAQSPAIPPPQPPASERPAAGQASPSNTTSAAVAASGEVSNAQEPTIVFESSPNCTAIFTVGADYLLWYLPKQHETTIVATDGSLANRVLATASDQQLDRRIWSGAQLTFGYWITEPSFFMPNAGIRTFGAETRLFALGERSLSVRNDTSPTIIRPFFDLNNRTDNGIVVAAPGLATGLVQASAEMNMWGAESNFWKSLSCNDPYSVCSVSVMAGVRYLEMDPQIEISQTTVYNQNLAAFPAFVPFAGNRLQVNELFATRNRFVGGQFGVRGTVLLERLVVDGSFKLALGTNHQEIHIEGSQVRTLANGTTTTSQGGLLALPSNIGRFQQDKFSQVPEFNIGLSCPILSCVTLKFDFMALYWSKILRAREQIDRVIDVTQIPNYPFAAAATSTGLGRPMVPYVQSGLWVLGVGFGAEVKW